MSGILVTHLRRVLESRFSLGTRQNIKTYDLYNDGTHQNFEKMALDSPNENLTSISELYDIFYFYSIQ